MKKIIIFIAAIAVIFNLSSCTEQEFTRSFGGTMTVKLEPGEKLMMATWKENDLFYLTEPMDSDYIPKKKYFKESSSYGVMESTIIFIETR